MARAYSARRMVKVHRLTVWAKLVRHHWAKKHINRPLGQWQNVIFCDESRFMLFRIDNRIRVRRLIVEAMNEDCTYGNVAHGGGSVHVHYGVASLIWEKPPCTFWIRCHWSRLSIEHIWNEIGRGFGGIGPSVSEPEPTGSCSPKYVATDPS